MLCVMNNKTKFIAGALIVVAVAFYGGLRYGQTSLAAANRNSRNFINRGAGSQSGQFAGRNIRGANLGSGFTRGSVLKKDAQSIIVSLPSGGSQIVWYSTSTEIQKIITSSISNVEIGQTITISGVPNNDGSLTANSIQLKGK